MGTRPRLRQRDRRAILIAVVTLTPFALFRVAVSPWLSYRSGLHEAVEAERDLHVRELALLQEGEDRAASIQEVDGLLSSLDDWWLQTGTEVAATGRLTRRISDAGERAGILIQEVRALPIEPSASSVQPVSVAVIALGDLEGVVRLLLALEDRNELLRIEELSLELAGLNDGELARAQLMSIGFVLTGFDVDRVQPGEALSGAAP